MHVAGPFAPAARAEDALILSREVACVPSFRDFARAGGTWLADYGFRGSRVPPNIDLRLPVHVPRGSQMSAQQADDSRQVTQWRWVVESANERIKNSRYFGTRRAWQEIGQFKRWMLAACLLSNRWSKPIAHNPP
jgi:hypothetical protein